MRSTVQDIGYLPDEGGEARPAIDHEMTRPVARLPLVTHLLIIHGITEVLLHDNRESPSVAARAARAGVRSDPVTRCLSGLPIILLSHTIGKPSAVTRSEVRNTSSSSGCRGRVNA